MRNFYLPIMVFLCTMLFIIGKAQPPDLTINNSFGPVSVNTCSPLSAFATYHTTYTGKWKYEFKLYRNGSHLATKTQTIDYNGGFPIPPLPAANFSNVDPISGNYTVALKVTRKVLFFKQTAFSGTSNGVQVNSTVNVGGSYSASKIAGRTVTGDFDNDGYLDDIAGFYDYGNNTSAIHVWRKGTGNNLNYQGDNGFWKANTFNSSKVVGTMVSGDFDNDGYHDDIATLYRYGGGIMKIWVFKSNGSSFSSQQFYSTSTFDPGKSKYRVVSGDFDGDNRHDDIAAFYDYGGNQTKIWVFRSNGSSFNISNYWTGNSFNSNNIIGKVVSGDFDGDNRHDDIATLYDYGNGTTKAWVFRSNGSSFSAANYWNGPSFVANKTTARVVSGDFDNDNKHDDLAAMYDYGSNTSKIWVFRSNGSSFSTASYYNTSTYNANKVSGRVVSGDFDHDNRHDDIMCMYDYGNSSVKWHNFRSNGSSFAYNGVWWEVCAGFSKTADVIAEALAESSSVLSKQEVKIYPNPFSSTLQLELPSDGETKVSVYDMQGKMVKTFSTLESSYQLDIENIPQGLYLVKVASKSGNKTFRVVKQ